MRRSYNAWFRCEQFHSNLVGSDVGVGKWMTEKQVWMLTGDVYPETAGLKEARGTGRGTISDAGLTAGYTWRTWSEPSLAFWSHP